MTRGSGEDPHSAESDDEAGPDDEATNGTASGADNPAVDAGAAGVGTPGVDGSDRIPTGIE